MQSTSNGHIYWALIAAVVELHGYDFSHAFAFDVEFSDARPDAHITAIAFSYRSDPKGPAERITLELQPISARAVPPTARGQRA